MPILDNFSYATESAYNLNEILTSEKLILKVSIILINFIIYNRN